MAGCAQCLQGVAGAPRELGGAGGLHGAPGPEGISHHRLFGGFGRRQSAPVHPVLRAPRTRKDRLFQVHHRGWARPGVGAGRGPPALRSRAEAWPALRGAGAQRPALGGGRGAPEDGPPCHLCARPQAFGPLHGPRLCAAQQGPAGHSRRHRQYREGRDRDPAHRRPGPGAHPGRGGVRPQLRRLGPRPAQGEDGRSGLEGRDGGALRAQQGHHDRLCRERGDPEPRPRRLCDDRRAGRWQEGAQLGRQGHPMVHRLRSRPHRLLRQGRRPRLRALACKRRAGRGGRGAARGPQQRHSRARQDG